jgi:GT2 family glycosyltransferase
VKEATVGVVVVTYRSSDVIVECLESLFGSTGVQLKVVVVDNASPDQTVEVIRDWASGRTPYQRPASSPLPPTPVVTKPIPLVECAANAVPLPLGALTLVRSPLNGGYGAGVNLGLKALQGKVDFYWVVNPDCVVPPPTASVFAARAQAKPDFGLMSCTLAYYAAPDRIQTAGGLINRLTATCSHRLAEAPLSALKTAPPPTLDWVTGANLVASRAYVDQVGLMNEDYFLYFEEVDWAFRRGAFPIDFIDDAIVYHHGGTSIGSGSGLRRASPLSSYLTYRNQIRFSRRFISRVPIAAYAYALGKAAQALLKGDFEQAQAITAGLFELRPPKSVSARIESPEAAALAFGRPA